jgi:hypothetical protein
MSAQDDQVTVPTEPRKSTEEVLYGAGQAQGISDRFGHDMEFITARLELNEKQSAELVRTTSEALEAMGLSREEGERYFGVLRQLVMKPATDEQLEAWRFETVRAANAKYGVDEAKERIAKLNAYLRADPRLKGQLEVGVGSHPRVVAMLLEKAHQLRLPKRSSK